MRLSLSDRIDNWLAPPPAPAKVEWISRHVFAHRGLHDLHRPENSPGAFAAAIAKGYGIECDVQRSADGEPMVFHDWDLDRLTGETGPVMARTAEELARTGLKASRDCIPRLRSVLAQVAGQVPLLLEVKSKRELPVSRLCAAIRDQLAGYSGLHAVMSFDPRVPRWFAQYAPDTVRGLVISEQGADGPAARLGRHIALWHGKPDFLAYDIRDLPAPFPARQRQRGLPVATWTVRNPDVLAKARAYADAPIAEGAGIRALDA
ncbi:MAG: glycerophosphodiester phosphodiesterase family protein [Novosphingobium sp.]|nr:glycerophosphodiester phosphodiesterase family protein [Novosphingobium sp.]